MKTLIFDFDGTLADSFGLVMEIAYELTGDKVPDDKEIARLRQLPLLKVVRELHIPLTRLPKLVLQGRQRMHERIGEVRPFTGTRNTLAGLHATDNHLLVISSNSEQNVRAFLRANKLEKYFDGVYGGVGLFNKAATLRKVIKRNNLDVRSCYYVGDEVRDMIAASRVGVNPVGVSWGYQAPEALEKCHPYALARKPSDLLAVFATDKL